ncbi:hypothetical protein PHYBLDRAFT_145182 [Phycomyces blakesleeanus NRRL 1555(-)]|uniref:Tc1-like transposase DDE domain-containing protein n=1 Tax=Phycomyces blakesleeanus (strain ATCC 8743b / DSM 1359 / FGSC 10004 / NBRC 33097 / NRRL 1555) TaxID=763407 RepID=A0A163AII3_PHYB8|nr:hypothetical protein PHYBLDRAFT_145182 [Phycomyces blakesleeanus NRRL 1555(-)]OAD73711.1 hypothetical protein PHYBLDRAFT_145182 [Phycomyces blakesleeanus NRRL 1555(-)]|eukprot:XP_018291751.1 hypothetical protein PHYBLDRAFT_145182 [Phycomyces blakesleeanus NRRL 1555(-)]
MSIILEHSISKSTICRTSYKDEMSSCRVVPKPLLPKAHKKKRLAFVRTATEFIYQEDNAPSHRSNLEEEWKRRQNLAMIVCPPNSPVISPLENLWTHLARKDNIQV